MEQNQVNQTVGSLKISEDVVATIAGLATKEVQGVASLANAPANIKGLILKNTVSKSIKIELNDDVAVIGVYVNLTYGAKIPEVAEKIQNNVKSAVQSMTGITVSKVNVFIVGIDFSEPKNAE